MSSTLLARPSCTFGNRRIKSSITKRAGDYSTRCSSDWSCSDGKRSRLLTTILAGRVSRLQRVRGFSGWLLKFVWVISGAVAARESSRFARNNKDWHHLVELCRMFDTLLIDQDVIYDATRE